ncbi:MAG: GNAT family N-acetyltransferase [Candidatus Bathyarchaeia archaeon]
MTYDQDQALNISGYEVDNKKLWDDFLSTSKNGVFLFNRDYMEYHSDRFEDHSLLISRKGKLIGLFPANIKDGSLYSHGGLTFGGVISDINMRTQIMMDLFQKVLQLCKDENITKVIYKPVPYIYHSIPADEDLYSLFRCNAKLIARNVTTSIYLPQKTDFDESRQRSIKKAIKNNLTVKQNYDFNDFMQILKEVLAERHGVAPVHSLEEIELLAKRFPDNIRLFSSYKDNVMLAGVMVYESKNVAHAQYIANSNSGRDLGALELVFDFLINHQYSRKKYFDFGISTEQMGHFLNTGLIAHKEGFGARAVMHDIYELTVPE